jgi:hypothetical protein
MDENYRILEELKIGDKKRRLDKLQERFHTMSHDDDDIIDVLEEMTQLQQECSKFMFDYHDDLIAEYQQKAIDEGKSQ